MPVEHNDVVLHHEEAPSITPARKRITASNVFLTQREAPELEEQIDELSKKLSAAEAAKQEALLELKCMRESTQASGHRVVGGSDDRSTNLEAQVAELREMLSSRDAAIESQRQRLAVLRSTAAGKDVESAGSAPPSGEAAQFKAVRQENKLLAQELDRMAQELGRLEQRLARGEFNTFRTRVVCPATHRAPCSECVGHKAKLREAEAARDKALALLNEAGAANASGGADNGLDGSGSLEAGLKIAELNRAIAEKDKYVQRLSEQAKQQIQEYKEVAKALFGFSLSKHKGANNKSAPGQYQVKSLFAEHSGDVLLVQAQDGGRQVDMLSSDYSVRLRARADCFFQQAHLFPPLPALLASISVEHYERLVAE
jgi:hypothetical protein